MEDSPRAGHLLWMGQGASRRSWGHRVGGLVMALLAWPMMAMASPVAVPLWRLSLEGGTDFPLSLGGRVALETPPRVRLSTSVGVLPTSYVRTVNRAANAVGLYDERIGRLIEQGLTRSLIWRSHLGLRPFAGSSFYVDAGYALVALGGSVSPEDVLLGLVGLQLPEGVPELDRRYQVSSRLQMVDAELGFQWYPVRHATIRAALGAAVTVHATTQVRVETSSPVIAAVAPRVTDRVEEELDHLYTKYVRFPVASLSMGYAF